MKHKYIVGLEIETDLPLSISSACKIVTDIVVGGVAKIVSVEAVIDEEDDEGLGYEHDLHFNSCI
jgi:hypothetical protein